VILVDANLLIYAIDSDAPNHARARKWLEDSLSGTAVIGLAWIVILAFLRLTTRPGILARPLRLEAALEFVDEWLSQPCVEAVGPGPGHWAVLRNLLKTTGAAGNLTSDAHLAALAIESGSTVHSTDNDFKRFPGIEHVNPLA